MKATDLKPDLKIDLFSFRTRLQPSFIMLLPLVMAAVAWTKPDAKWLGALWSLLSAAGITFFLSNLARNKGKEAEAKLYALWGGTPTTQLLRHKGPGNPVLRERWHKKLSSILGISLPDAQQESANPSAADAAYEAATKLLIGKTRDSKIFPFVYRDNLNYNFCRNLYGLKSAGLTLSLLGFVATVLAAWHFFTISPRDYMPWGCAVVCAFLFFWWWRAINPNWVRIPAFNYAQHLLEATENVAAGRKPKDSVA